MARPEKEPFMSITFVIVQSYSKHYMRFDLSPYSLISSLKQEVAKCLKLPTNQQQKWLIPARNGPIPIDDRRRLHDYDVSDTDVIEAHIENLG